MASKKTASRVLKVKKKSTFLKSIVAIVKDPQFQKLSGVLSFFIIAPYLVISFTSYLFTWDKDMSLVKEYGFALLFNTEVIVENWLGRLVLSYLIYSYTIGLESLPICSLFLPC